MFPRNFRDRNTLSPLGSQLLSKFNKLLACPSDSLAG
jgi:hypothetical protein